MTPPDFDERLFRMKKTMNDLNMDALKDQEERKGREQ